MEFAISGTMRSTAGLSSLRHVPSQAPSLPVELVDRLRPPPGSHVNNKRLGREGEGGGDSRIRYGERLEWSPVAELPLPALAYTNCRVLAAAPLVANGWPEAPFGVGP